MQQLKTKKISFVNRFAIVAMCVPIALVKMRYAYYNENPAGRSVGDCTVRALSKALGQKWEQTYVGLCIEGFMCGDLPNADDVYGRYLFKHGFRRHLIPDNGLGCYTVEDFANEHPFGVYVLSIPGRHVVTVENGKYWDSWDSGNERPGFYWAKER